MNEGGHQGAQSAPETKEDRPAAGAKASDAQQGHHTNPWLFGLLIGSFAGLIWGAVRWLLYTFQFTKLPGFLAEPFFLHAFLVKWQGHLVGIVCFMVFSIAAAYLYVLLFRRLRGPLPGLGYGALWWAILFWAVGPATGTMPPPFKLGWTTLLSELCVFLLWGLFIGYSINFEFTDEASREPEKSGSMT